MEELLRTVGYNKAVTKFILNEDDSLWFDYMNELDSFYINVNGVQKYIKDIVISGYNGRSYYYMGETMEKSEAIKTQPDYPLNSYQMPFRFLTTGWQRPVFLLSTYVADPSDRYALQWLYEDFRLVDRQPFPMLMDVQVLKNGNPEGGVKIHYSRIQLDEPLKLDFSVPSKYKRITFAQVLKTITNLNQ